jgi:hypothetical protein
MTYNSPEAWRKYLLDAINLFEFQDANMWKIHIYIYIYFIGVLGEGQIIAMVSGVCQFRRPFYCALSPWL